MDLSEDELKLLEFYSQPREMYLLGPEGLTLGDFSYKEERKLVNNIYRIDYHTQDSNYVVAFSIENCVKELALQSDGLEDVRRIEQLNKKNQSAVIADLRPSWIKRESK